MANPTLVNGQITDSVSQANLLVAASAPAQAVAAGYATLAQSIALGMQNATSNQQQLTTIAMATVVESLNLICGIDTSTATAGGAQIAATMPSTGDQIRMILRRSR